MLNIASSEHLLTIDLTFEETFDYILSSIETLNSQTLQAEELMSSELSTLRSAIASERSHLEDLKSERARLEDQLSSYDSPKHHPATSYRSSCSEYSPNSPEDSSELLALYHKLTGIEWDYNSTLISGKFSNGKCFKFSQSSSPNFFTVNQLWEYLSNLPTT